MKFRSTAAALLMMLGLVDRPARAQEAPVTELETVVCAADAGSPLEGFDVSVNYRNNPHVVSGVTGEDGCTDVVTFPVNVGSEDEVLPDAFKLDALYPNPVSSGDVTAEFTLERAEPVRFVLADALGRQYVAEDFGLLSPGRHELRWSSEPLSTGVYVFSVQAGQDVMQGKFVDVGPATGGSTSVEHEQTTSSVPRPVPAKSLRLGKGVAGPYLVDLEITDPAGNYEDFSDSRELSNGDTLRVDMVPRMSGPFDLFIYDLLAGDYDGRPLLDEETQVILRNVSDGSVTLDTLLSGGHLSLDDLPFSEYDIDIFHKRMIDSLATYTSRPATDPEREIVAVKTRYQDGFIDTKVNPEVHAFVVDGTDLVNPPSLDVGEPYDVLRYWLVNEGRNRSLIRQFAPGEFTIMGVGYRGENSLPIAQQDVDDFFNHLVPLYADFLENSIAVPNRAVSVDYVLGGDYILPDNQPENSLQVYKFADGSTFGVAWDPDMGLGSDMNWAQLAFKINLNENQGPGDLLGIFAPGEGGQNPLFNDSGEPFLTPLGRAVLETYNMLPTGTYMGPQIRSD